MSDRTDAPTRKRQTRQYPQVRALCCDCGNVRQTSTHGAYGEPHPDTVEWYGERGQIVDRCTLYRECPVCQRRTRHAWLRDDLAPEKRRPERTLSDAISPIITEQIRALEACEVRVWWDFDRWKDGQVGMLRQWFDDNVFHLELNPDAHVVHLAGAVEAAWLELLEYKGDLGGSWWRSVAGDPNDPDRPAHRYRMFIVPPAD